MWVAAANAHARPHARASASAHRVELLADGSRLRVVGHALKEWPAGHPDGITRADFV